MKFIEYTGHHPCFLIQVVGFVPDFLWLGKKEHLKKAGHKHPAALSLSPVNH